MRFDLEQTIARARIEDAEDWRGAIDTMPFIKFPADWEVQVIPPFAGATVRFRVRLPSGVEKSIYLDSHDRLGFVGEPYWEVYPCDGDTGQCLKAEIAELLKLIESAV
jgi:hypothetical protein